MIALAENVQWGSSPRIYVSFYYEKTRDGANMKYRTKTVISPLTGSSYFGYSIEQLLNMDGADKEHEVLKDNSPSQWGDDIEYVSPWYTISNKTSGTTSVTFNLFSTSGRDDYFEYSMAVDPAYTSITSFSVVKRNETSVTYSFATAHTCDYAWYSTNDGSSWTGVDITDGTSGSFNVTGLNPNTTYNFKLRVRRKDSQLTTDSNRVQQTTYKVPSQSFSSKTETSITMNWSVDSTADYIWYSKDNGSNWTAVGSVNATSGSYTISGLTANTSYNIKTRVRRKAPQTTYDTTTTNITTYNYPYVSLVGTTELTIGNSQTLTLYNPLSRSVTIKMKQNNASGTELYSGTTSGTSTTFTPTANTLYSSIPNSSSAYCVYSVIYGSSTKTTATNTTKYKIIGNEVPTFTNFTYADTNATTTALTGNNKILISGYSNVTATISTSDKAVANNGASMNNYILTIGNQSAQANYSASSDVTMTINNVTSGTIKISANDSRTLNKVVTKTATIKDYFIPATTKLTATRGNNGVGEEVTLAFEGNWWNNNFGSVTNTIQNIQYYFRKSTTDTWTTGSTTITFSTNQNKFSGSLVVYGDTTTHGFDVTSSYYLKIVVTDRLDHSEEYQTTIGSGTPALAIYKDNVAIGQQYNTNAGGKLQVNGDIIQSGQPQNTQFSGHFFHAYYPNSSQVYEHFYPQSQHGTQSTTTSTANLRVWDGTNKTFKAFTISGNGSVNWAGTITSTFSGNLSGNATTSSSCSGNSATATTATTATILKTTNTGGYQTDQYGNFKHQSNSTGNTWNIYNNAGSSKFSVNFETGLTKVNGSQEVATKRVSLYSNTSGTTGNITLSETSANFQYIDITAFDTNQSQYFGVRIGSPNGKKVALGSPINPGENNFVRIILKSVNISGTTISNANSSALNIYHGTINGSSGGNEVSIIRVDGYR